MKKILSVTPVECNDEVIYDLHVKDNHNYVLSNGLIAHNSGKGFVLKNLIGLQGRVFDVDALKLLAVKSKKISKRVKEEFDVELEDLELDKPDDVFTLHTIIGDELNLPKKQQQAFFTSILANDPSRKPNIIFDVTLKDMKKFDNITRSLNMLGYDKKKIHIVWVVNDVTVAKEQNKNRERVVPEHILINTHKGVNITMQDIVSMGKDLRSLMDGDIVFSFNKINVDNEYVQGRKYTGSVVNRKKKYSAGYMKRALYVRIKEAGKPPMDIKDISKDILRKIDEYTPDNTNWQDYE